MRNRCFPLLSRPLAALLLVTFVAASRAEDGQSLSISQAIDQYIGQRLAESGVPAAPATHDAKFARRVTLDLQGRIPTLHEARGFVESTSPDKRTQLVDRLMGGENYVLHQANVFDTYLMYGTGKSIREYLVEAFRENRPWDAMFRDLILGNSDPKLNQSQEFIRARVGDLDKLSNAASVLFFGVNVSCAQCHDHPMVGDWTQDRYYGMKSFFNRLYLNGDFVGERSYGTVDFTTTAGEKKQAQLMFLTGALVEEPAAEEPDDKAKKAEKELLEELKKKKQPPPQPEFSRRAQLVEVALRPDQRHYLARAIVNQLFYQLLGRGLVSPIDQMHPENAPSHPQLIQWLADDLVAHDYDLKRLIRGIVLSDTYARVSAYETSGEMPGGLFAAAQVRPLSPAQYSSTLRLASSHPDRFPEQAEGEQFAQQLLQLEGWARGFARHFEVPTDGFQVSVAEALLMSNGAEIEKQLLRDGKDSLVDKLLELPDHQQRIEVASWNVFSRAPDAEEQKVLGEFLKQREDRLRDACRQLVWAMLTSSESRFNH